MKFKDYLEFRDIVSSIFYKNLNLSVVGDEDVENDRLFSKNRILPKKEGYNFYTMKMLSNFSSIESDYLELEDTDYPKTHIIDNEIGITFDPDLMLALVDVHKEIKERCSINIRFIEMKIKNSMLIDSGWCLKIEILFDDVYHLALNALAGRMNEN